MQQLSTFIAESFAINEAIANPFIQKIFTHASQKMKDMMIASLLTKRNISLNQLSFVNNRGFEIDKISNHTALNSIMFFVENDETLIAYSVGNGKKTVVQTDIKGIKSFDQLIEYCKTASIKVYELAYSWNLTSTADARSWKSIESLSLGLNDRLDLYKGKPSLFTAIKGQAMASVSASIDLNAIMQKIEHEIPKVVQSINTNVALLGAKLSLTSRDLAVTFNEGEIPNSSRLTLFFNKDNNRDNDRNHHQGVISCQLFGPSTYSFGTNFNINGLNSTSGAYSYEISQYNDQGQRTSKKYVAEINSFVKKIEKLPEFKLLAKYIKEYQDCENQAKLDNVQLTNVSNSLINNTNAKPYIEAFERIWSYTRGRGARLTASPAKVGSEVKLVVRPRPAYHEKSPRNGYSDKQLLSMANEFASAVNKSFNKDIAKAGMSGTVTIYDDITAEDLANMK